MHPLSALKLRAYSDKGLTIEPSTIGLWDETIEAAGYLLSGQSDKGFGYEIAVCNSVLSTMVTGFEAYSKKRFLELETEGISANTEALIAKFTSRAKRSSSFQNINSEAESAGKSVLAYFVDMGRINFQSYDDCKRAYNKAYKLSFGDIGLNSKTLAPLQKYFKYRHLTVHTSPLLPGYYIHTEGVAGIEKASKKLAQEVVDCFKIFIEYLHRATLKLR